MRARTNARQCCSILQALCFGYRQWFHFPLVPGVVAHDFLKELPQFEVVFRVHGGSHGGVEIQHGKSSHFDALQLLLRCVGEDANKGRCFQRLIIPDLLCNDDGGHPQSAPIAHRQGHLIPSSHAVNVYEGKDIAFHGIFSQTDHH